MSDTPGVVARRWIAARLAHASIAAAGSTGIYRAPAPNAAVYPFVAVQVLTERPISAMGQGTDEINRLDIDVTVWDTGESSARADAIAAAINEQLHRAAPGTVTGGRVDCCLRVSGVPIDSPIENGVQFQKAGGVYETWVTIT